MILLKILTKSDRTPQHFVVDVQIQYFDSLKGKCARSVSNTRSIVSLVDSRTLNRKESFSALLSLPWICPSRVHRIREALVGDADPFE
jgi:hypothetical protein